MGGERAPLLRCGKHRHKLICRKVLRSMITSAYFKPQTDSSNSPQLLEFGPDGSVTDERHSPDSLGLAPRDVSLFSAGGGPAGKQRATIISRDGMVFFRSEQCRAIVAANRCAYGPLT